MTDEAIDQDVSEQEQEPQVEEATVTESEQNLSPRELKMQEIVSKRHEVLEGEMDDHRAVGNLPPKAEVVEEASSEEFTLEMESDGSDPDDVAQDDALDAQDSISEDVAPKTKTLKVNGQLVELTEDQYEAALQKDLSGDVKLQAAYEREQKLAQWEQQLKAQQAQLQQPQTPLPDEGVDEAIDEAARKAFEELISGNTDDAVENLRVALKSAGNTQPRIDVNALKDSIKAEVRNEAQQEQTNQAYQKGWSKFAGAEEYKAIVTNPKLLKYADIELAEIRSNPANADLTPYEEYAKAGDAVLGMFGDKATPEIKPKLESDRQARKEQLKPIPKGQGNVVRKAREAEVVDYSPQAKIERMRASRSRG